MKIEEVKAHQEMKEHLMRHEGVHPANQPSVDLHNHHNPDRQGTDYNAHGSELQ